jgi:histidine ammonia-lyase
LKTSPELQKVIAALRAAVPSLEEDRYMAPDLKAAAELIASGALVATISDGILPKLEV